MRMRTGFLLAVAAVLGAVNVGSAQFTAGSLTVLRTGDGTAALSNASTAVFLDQYNPTGSQTTPTFTVALPTSGAAVLTNSGSATSEGQITRSADGSRIIVAGYGVGAGTTGVATTTSADVPRVVNAVTAGGTVTRIGATGTNFSGSNIRSAASLNGTTAYAVGGNSGTVLLPDNTTVSTTATNQRVANIFNGTLYTSTQAGTARGIYQVGTGLPTAGGTASTAVIDTGGTSQPNAFAFNPAGTVAYIADDRTVANGGGIQKWTGSGTTWTLAGTFNSLSGTSGARGLAVDFSGTNPVLYATTTDNRLVSLTDAGNFAAAADILATAGTNQAFRSVVFSPVPEPATVGLVAAAVLGGGALLRRYRQPRGGEAVVGSAA